MSTTSTRRTGVVLATAALAGALALGAPLAASAHVHVDPQTAKAGADSTPLSFAVPNESATATTTEVSVALPAGADLTEVEAGTVPGWTAKVVKKGGVPVRVDWKADGDGIGDGETVHFPLEVGPVPDTGSIAFEVAQTYSDDTVVHWDDPTPASGEEPEAPAPTLYINDAPPADHDEAAAEEDAHATETTAAVSGTGDAALVLAGSALAVSVAAVVLALFALLRAARKRRA